MIDETNWRETYKDFNKDLEAKILEANNDSSLVKWSKLLPELMGADVFIAGQFGDMGVNEKGEKLMNLLMLQKGTQTIVPFFTSPERMSVLISPENTSFDVMKMNLTRFMQSAGRPIVLNPMSSYSRAFSPFEMKILVAENQEKKPAYDEDGVPVTDTTTEKGEPYLG